MSRGIRITDAFLGEHGVLYGWLDALETTLSERGEAGPPGAPSTEQVAAIARTMAAVLGSHARAENELLLDELARRNAEAGPLAVMRREHADIEGLIEEARGEVGAGDAVRAVELLLEAIAVAREHFEKEELAAFPAAERALDEGSLEALGLKWAERRRVRLGD